MIEAFDSPYLVPFDGRFDVARARTQPQPDVKPSKKEARNALANCIEELTELQNRFYAHDKYSLLLIFQAMDAAGKDSTIRAVMSGIDPSGCQVFSFKKPSSLELDHDFLWRTACRLPERGRIGIFNRSYYEEVLVVRVHPEILDFQRLPYRPPLDLLWEQRMESIRDHEKHLARNGTVIIKFWLNVSQREQHQRFLSRIDRPRKNWKFSMADVQESRYWDDYMHAYGEALRQTSRPHAPWYAIPADYKPYMRLTVAKILVGTLRNIDPTYPELGPEARADLELARKKLTEMSR